MKMLAGNRNLLKDVEEGSYGGIVHQGALEVGVLEADGGDELGDELGKAGGVVVFGVLRAELYMC